MILPAKMLSRKCTQLRRATTGVRFVSSLIVRDRHSLVAQKYLTPVLRTAKADRYSVRDRTATFPPHLSSQPSADQSDVVESRRRSRWRHGFYSR